MIICAQMFTVHEQCQTLEGISESLKKIADIGYKSVQVSGTCPYDAMWLKEELDKNGLTCNLTHIPYDNLINHTEKVIKDHDILECKYIGVGSMPHIFEPGASKKNWVDFANDTMIIGKKIAESGHYYMYHNHSHEFKKDENGEYAMEYLTKTIPAEYMGYTLDTYWIKAGGHDIIEWFEKLKNQIPCIHLKDMKIMNDGEQRYAPIGKGIIDFEKVIEKALELNVEYAFVEQDKSYGEDPFDCLKQSYEYLTSLGLK